MKLTIEGLSGEWCLEKMRTGNKKYQIFMLDFKHSRENYPNIIEQEIETKKLREILDREIEDRFYITFSDDETLALLCLMGSYDTIFAFSS
jgi:hypothetical protein